MLATPSAHEGAVPAARPPADSKSEAARRAERENNFDLLRLIAATQVAFLHGITHLNVEVLAAFGNSTEIVPGVPIFFVISGFLVTLSYERSGSLKQYVANRVLRVYPAMWLCLAISLAIVLAYKLPYDAKSLALWVAAQATVVQFWNPDFIRGFGVGVMNGSLWTIPVELQFYVAIPVLYFVGTRIVRPSDQSKNNWASAAAVVVALGALTALSHEYFAEDMDDRRAKMYFVTVVPWLYYFMVGWFFRRVHTAAPQLFVGKVLYWLAAYAAWTAMAGWVLHWRVMGNYLNPVSVVLIGGCVISLAFTMPGLSNRILRRNDISYGMYIYHMILVNLFITWGLVNSVGWLIAMLAGTFTLGLVSWRFLEKPALSLKHSAWLRSQPKLTAPTHTA